MLHQRRGASGAAMARAGSMLRALLGRTADSDPGLMRLLMASRGTLSVFLTTVAAMFVAKLGGWPVIEFASGVTLSMMGPFLMREPTVGQRQRTLLALLLPAVLATVATSVLHASGPIGDGFFLVLVFICFLLQPLSPRAIGLGLVAVITSYVGLFLELPPATLPVQLLSLLLAGPIIAFACFVAVPMDPAATLMRLIGAVQGRAAQVLRSAGGQGGPALRRDLARLNEAALAADDQLGLVQPDGVAGLRHGLMDVELATGKLIEALGREGAGPRQAARLLLHGRRMRRGGRYAMDLGAVERGTVRAGLVELGHALHAVGAAARLVTSGGPIAPAAGPSPGTSPGTSPGPLAWRIATRVTLAAGLAMAGGIMLSPQRWFWAVITVYVVFLNARSRGDTIYKGAQRVGGTLLGIASGLALADLLAGSPWVQAGVLLLAIFGMYYWFLVSYTAGIFCVTVMLGLLYGMLGASTEQLLVLRLEETAIGAAAAMFVAAFVFPVRTRDQVLRSGRGVIACLVEVVRACRCALAGSADTAPLAAMRRVDRQVADLRLALAPLTAGRVLVRRTSLERPVPALLECVRWARILAAACQSRPPGARTGAVIFRAAAIEARLAALAGNPPTQPARTERDDDGPEDAELMNVLDHLEAATALLQERIEIGALEGFGVDR